MVTGGEEEEEETKRNNSSRRHQNLKASSSRGGPQFVRGNKSPATKYLHTCCAAREISRDGNSGQEEEEEEAEEGPEDEAREWSGIHKSSPSFRTRSSWNTRVRTERQCRQAGLPLVTPCVAQHRTGGTGQCPSGPRPSGPEPSGPTLLALSLSLVFCAEFLFWFLCAPKCCSSR
jgi:hypothetical protein